MGRANNTSRSLQIISRANGWDPTQIIGEAYNYNENRVTEGDSRTIPDAISRENRSEDVSIQSMPEMDMGWKGTRTVNADPKPGGGVR